MTKRSRTVFLVLGLMLALLAPAASAQSEDGTLLSTPQTVQVHRVDATGDLVELTMLSSTYTAATSDVTVVENGVEVGISAVATASAKRIGHDIVFVLDTNNRLVQGEVFSKMKAAIAAEIRNLPANTRVGVVSAGDIATVPVGLTDDLASAALDVELIGNSTGSAFYNAIERASGMMDNDPNRIRTLIVVSGGTDTTSTASIEGARSSLVQKGTQYVGIAYGEVDSGLNTIPGSAGGYVVRTTDPAQVAPAIVEGVSLGRDRLVVSYKGQATSREIRGDVVLSVAGLETRFSHVGGTFEDHLVRLRPAVVTESTGFAFFRSQNGLYVGIGLAFVATALMVWALGSLFAGGDTSLESLLSRYAEQGDSALDEEESSVVQTALVKRAVELSETFAEDKGFLLKIEGSLERARLPLRAGEFMSIFTGVVLMSSFLAFFLLGGSFVGALVVAAVVAAILIFAVNFMAKRRMKAFEKQLPDTLQLLAGTLRAGYSLPQGLEAVSKEIPDPMGYELTRVMTEARLGRELEDALSSTADRLESDDFAWAVMAIAIQREVGGNLNELLMTVSDTMIARERLQGEVAALTAEGKMSAAILGALPPGLGFVMYLMNPEYVRPLFETTMGNIIIGLAFVLMAMGMAWMKKVITINV